MPPVTKAGGQQFRKDVEFVATKDSDEYELEAVGIVMVPSKVDLQNDFVREGTIRDFADQFETFVEAGQAAGGIMHAVWPDGWMDLTRNEVLDDSEEINGQTVDPGAWVQRWGVTNADLAELIDDGILSGYSIGAIQVDWNGPFEQDELDDVDTSEVPDDEVVWELIAGIIREVSAVDIPAVPDAQILEAKALQKRLADHLGNRDGFIEEALQRGHAEAEAERLWDVLNAAVEADGSAEPGKQSGFAAAGKAFLKELLGTDEDTTTQPSEPPDTAKEGRTLSAANRDDLKASIDAAVSILDDAGVDHGITRFTDREDDAFDLSEHEARAFDTGDGEDEDNPFDVVDAADEQSDKDAPGGDTPDDTNENMSDDNDNGEDLKDLVEQQQEQIKELNDAVGTLADTLAPEEEEKTVELEIGGELVEVTESEAKSWFDENDDGQGDAEGSLKSEVERLHERLDRINEQSGQSQQLSGHTAAAGRDGDGKDSALDALATHLN